MGAASKYGFHGFSVLLRHVFAKALQVFRAEGAKNLIDCLHIRAPA